mmetsp:Transcript_52315/g.122912  ORF Transcript_52315/g.122912 Transcript_52315/m.122912 type:complete len:82 (+) Transcript_52315:735-980(+)
MRIAVLGPMPVVALLDYQTVREAGEDLPFRASSCLLKTVQRQAARTLYRIFDVHAILAAGMSVNRSIQVYIHCTCADLSRH